MLTVNKRSFQRTSSYLRVLLERTAPRPWAYSSFIPHLLGFGSTTTTTMLHTTTYIPVHPPHDYRYPFYRTWYSTSTAVSPASLLPLVVNENATSGEMVFYSLSLSCWYYWWENPINYYYGSWLGMSLLVLIQQDERGFPLSPRLPEVLVGNYSVVCPAEQGILVIEDCIETKPNVLIIYFYNCIRLSILVYTGRFTKCTKKAVWFFLQHRDACLWDGLEGDQARSLSLHVQKRPSSIHVYNVENHGKITTGISSVRKTKVYSNCKHAECWRTWRFNSWWTCSYKQYLYFLRKNFNFIFYCFTLKRGRYLHYW